MRRDRWGWLQTRPLQYKAELVIWLLLVLALLPGCTLVDRATRFTVRTVTRITGGTPDAPARDPLYLHLQLAMLSDYVVTQLVQQTAAPLAAAKEPNDREMLLRLRLDYASAVWDAASGPNPFANAVDMLVTLAIGRKQIERSAVAEALGASLRPTLDVLASAEHDAETLVQTFLEPAEYQALRDAIETKGDTSVEGHGLSAIDLEKLLRTARGPSGGGRGPTTLFRILGMDPFAGLDPATREIAQSRQFGERLLFNLQRLPFLLRLNAQLLSNDISRDLGLERALASLERASAAMNQVAQTASALPDRLDAERAQLVADVRAEADRLGTLAREYRGTFEAATTTAATANQALQTFGGVMERFQPADGQASETSRPFDITEYSQTATRISEAAVNLSALLERVDETLDSPGLARVTPQAAAVLQEADERGHRLLYTAFALGCGLIAFASLAVIVTASILRRLRGRSNAVSTRPTPRATAS